MAAPTLISLFSGAGGLDYGFEAAGYDTRLVTDSNFDACESIRQSRPWNVVQQDIGKFSAREMLVSAGLIRGDLDILIGGPPCQPFSKSGFWRKYGTHRLADPRSKMLGAYMRVVEETLPRVFLLENVQGIKFAELDQGFELLLRSIERINKRRGTRYSACFAVLNAAHYGVPQLRERLFLVAAKDGSNFDFPKAKFGTGRGHLPFRTAWDAIGDLQREEEQDREDLEVTGKWATLLPSIPEGANYLWHTARGGGEPFFGWRSRYWTFLLKLAKNRPSWTLQANPGPSCGPFHWKNRRLSVRELARLQTFPDDARFAGSSRSQRRQIGNAVPSLLAEVIAREIAVQLLGCPQYAKPPVLLPRKRRKTPRQERRRPVPESFESLLGDHPDHPGVGLGRGALARSAA